MIILISGKQGSGKTTQSQLLKEKLEKMGHSVSTLKFASVLYEMHDSVRAILKKNGVINYDYKKKDGYLLQLLGKEWGRDTIDEDVWADCMTVKAEKCESAFLIIDDMRFRNEFDGINGGVNDECFTIRLECSAVVRKKRVSMWRETENHLSETDLDIYVQKGKFDLRMCTETVTADVVSDTILKEIQKRCT